MDAAEAAPSLYFVYHIHLLRVLKQVLVMFLSVNSDEFRLAQPVLERFVLNPETRGLPNDVSVYAFLTNSHLLRNAGGAGMVDFETGVATVFSEITFPPFGLLLVLGSPSPDERLVDISWFANYRYDERKTVGLRLPLLPIYSKFPGDYRSRDQVLTDAAGTDE